MHLPSQYVCIHTQGCVCARDTEQSKEGMHNHTLVQDFQTTLEISLHAYLVFQCRQYLSSRLTWLPVWFLVNFISPPRQGRSSMIHTLHGSSLQCKCIHKKKKILISLCYGWVIKLLTGHGCVFVWSLRWLFDKSIFFFPLAHDTYKLQ